MADPQAPSAADVAALVAEANAPTEQRDLMIGRLARTLEQVQAERDRAEASEEALEAKLEALVGWDKDAGGIATCGCSYDHRDDVCAVHSPKLQAALVERDRLRAFVAEFVRESCWGEVPADGGDVQDRAVAAGILVEVQRTVPCGEDCGCAEMAASGEVVDCYRFAWTQPAPRDGDKP